LFFFVCFWLFFSSLSLWPNSFSTLSKRNWRHSLSLSKQETRCADSLQTLSIRGSWPRVSVSRRYV
jgi:hypothetical protein